MMQPTKKPVFHVKKKHEYNLPALQHHEWRKHRKKREKKKTVRITWASDKKKKKKEVL